MLITSTLYISLGFIICTYTKMNMFLSIHVYMLILPNIYSKLDHLLCIIFHMLLVVNISCASISKTHQISKHKYKIIFFSKFVLYITTSIKFLILFLVLLNIWIHVFSKDFSVKNDGILWYFNVIFC